MQPLLLAGVADLWRVGVEGWAPFPAPGRETCPAGLCGGGASCMAAEGAQTPGVQHAEALLPVPHTSARAMKRVTWPPAPRSAFKYGARAKKWRLPAQHAWTGQVAAAGMQRRNPKPSRQGGGRAQHAQKGERSVGNTHPPQRGSAAGTPAPPPRTSRHRPVPRPGAAPPLAGCRTRPRATRR